MEQLLTKKDAEELPDLEEFQMIPQFLKSLSAVTETPLFVKELRDVIAKIIRSPPHRLNDKYRQISFEITRELFQLVGPEWLENDQTLLCLFAHLVTVQLRVILDNPQSIDLAQLTVCCSILENCIRCVEDEDSFKIDDEFATKVSVTCREAVNYAAEYWAKAKDSNTEELPVEVECVLYRLICVFLSIGGSQIMIKNDLSKISPYLIKICWMAVEREEYETAKQLILVIHELPTLEVTVLKMFFSFIDISGEFKADAIYEVEVAIDILRNRADWYNEESLQEAIVVARNKNYSKLLSILSGI